ncbi:Hsp20/alpha crystallin family protein [Sulfurimonas sp.]|uniref:Hsp20/alpha crystallin family protein n=1 Tax=Sulfurimonas sp. TaxID=2022749 RepID=UPI00356A2ACC
MNSSIKSIKIFIAVLIVAIFAIATQAHMTFGLKNSDDENLSKTKERRLHSHYHDHFKEFQEMQMEFERIFSKFNSRFFDDEHFKDAFGDDFFHRPLVDMTQTSKEYIIKMDVPGVNNSSIKTIIEDNMLTVKAQVDKMTEDNSSSFMRKERYINKFQRSITLPMDADTSKMRTDYKDGVLTITIPKK